MTNEEIKLFRDEFKRIVYKKSQIKDKSMHLSRLHVWDKNGSHEDAIKKNIGELNLLRVNFKEMLQGSTYEEWYEMSNAISKIQSAIKQSRTIKAKENNELKLQNLKTK